LVEHYSTRRKVAGSIPDEVTELILAAGPGFDSGPNRNEYQESSWGVEERLARKADNLTAICEPIV
jgi:hypothetical protein